MLSPIRLYQLGLVTIVDFVFAFTDDDK